jgi:hypothetical protein
MSLLEPKRQTGGIAVRPGSGHQPGDDVLAARYHEAAISSARYR